MDLPVLPTQKMGVFLVINGASLHFGHLLCVCMLPLHKEKSEHKLMLKLLLEMKRRK